MKFIRENILKILIVLGVVVIIFIVVMAFASSGMGGKKMTYSRIEENLKNATVKYLQSYPDLLPKEEDQVVTVQMEQVYTDKQIQKIVSPEDSNVRCTGYTNVKYILNSEGGKEYRITPHIICGDKYETETLKDHIMKNEEIVDYRDGLYLIGNEYVYRGEDPHNYVHIGETTYRILSIDSEGYIRMIDFTGTGDSLKTVWDDRYNITTDRYDGINDYSISRLRENVLYLYNETEFYTSTEKNMFNKREYCLGKRSEENIGINRDEECSVLSNEDPVSLPLLYDYFITSIDPNCHTIEDESCQNYNYMVNIGTRFTATGSKENSEYVYQIGPDNLSRANRERFVSLVVYISDVTYVSGTGTEEDPYIVK